MLLLHLNSMGKSFGQVLWPRCKAPIVYSQPPTHELTLAGPTRYCGIHTGQSCSVNTQTTVEWGNRTLPSMCTHGHTTWSLLLQDSRAQQCENSRLSNSEPLYLWTHSSGQLHSRICMQSTSTPNSQSKPLSTKCISNVGVYSVCLWEGASSASSYVAILDPLLEHFYYSEKETSYPLPTIFFSHVVLGDH